mmetsp:Transcript_20693/g.49119  ORF Transcript_20693/g.49119 Transcript_20693/m.49119 type:complete len:527 (+) Transcript_20693:590-2170(+)
MATNPVPFPPLPRQRPLRGVVFDMDGTLTIPNLDFDEMYSRCGVDKSADILEEIAKLTTGTGTDEEEEEEEKAKARQKEERMLQIIEDMEEEARKTLQLMPGAYETLMWLKNHQIPIALVTRNTQASVDRLEELLLLRQKQKRKSGGGGTSTVGSSTSLSGSFFDVTIPRDFVVPSKSTDKNSVVSSFPPKPDPSSMTYIIEECWKLSHTKNKDDDDDDDYDDNDDGEDALSSSSHAASVLMVGDSLSNDVVYGIRANTRTALLDRRRQATATTTTRQKDTTTSTTSIRPDLTVQNLWELPRQLWLMASSSTATDSNVVVFDGIPGQLGTNSPLIKYDVPEILSTTPDGGDDDAERLRRLSEVCADGDLSTLQQQFTQEQIIDVFQNTPSGSNTPLIWAADNGHIEVVQYLIDVLPSSSSSSSSECLNHRGYLDSTAVCRAARRGHTDVLKILATGGSDLDIPNLKMQYPLHFAAFKQHLDCVEMLLKYGANPLVLDRKGRTPSQDTSDDAIRSRLEQSMEQYRLN